MQLDRPASSSGGLPEVARAVKRGQFVLASIIWGRKSRRVEGWPRSRGFLCTIYSKGDAIGTKVSVRYRRSGRLSEVVVKRGSTVYDVSFALLRAHSVNAHAQLFRSRALVATPRAESQEQELKACACSYVCIML